MSWKRRMTAWGFSANLLLLQILIQSIDLRSASDEHANGLLNLNSTKTALTMNEIVYSFNRTSDLRAKKELNRQSKLLNAIQANHLSSDVFYFDDDMHLTLPIAIKLDNSISDPIASSNSMKSYLIQFLDIFSKSGKFIES